MSNNKEIMQEMLYMESLRPETGYEVDFAVGTTYSLSMEGLLSVPLAFTRMGEQKELSPQTAMYMMEGIRRGSDKFVLFCNRGSIHVPSKCQPIYSLLEKSVVEISYKENPLINFHPKLWVIRQKPVGDNNGNVLIKIVIMSRNLTFSADLDCAISIIGSVENGGDNSRNAPLAGMLRDLAAEYETDETRNKKINALANDLMKVKNFDFEAPFSQTVYELHPFMSGKKDYNETHLLHRLLGKRVLVISPFVTEDILRVIAQNAEKAFLVTRDNNVSKEILDLFKGNVFVPNPALDDNEKCSISLHAKMYLVERGNGAVYLYLGSSNATKSAFDRNAEMTIGVRLNNATFDQMFCELVEKDGLYWQVSAPTANHEEEMEKRKKESDMEHIARWAIDSVSKAKVRKQEEQARPFEVTLIIEKKPKDKYDISQCFGDYAIYYRPLQCKNQSKKLGEETLVWNLSVEDLSEFYVVNVSSKSVPAQKVERVFKVCSPRMDRFVQERNEKIVNSIVTADNIMQYIEMMLSDFPEYTMEQWNQRKKKNLSKGGSVYDDSLGLAIYEQLLKASYDDPSKLDELKDVLNKLTDEDYDEELISVLRAFGIKLKGKKK